MQTVSAKLKYMHMSSRKVRLAANVIKGMQVNDAEAQLLVTAGRSRDSILRLLRSAIANATHNLKLDPTTLFIKEIRVDGGPMTKKWTPRARGSASKIEKKTSHITIVLGVREPRVKRFNIVPVKKTEAAKPAKKSSETKAKHAHDDKSGAEKPKEAPRTAPKIFSRKAI